MKKISIIKKMSFLFLFIMPIVLLATMCGPNEEYVFVKNNSNKSILCIPNFNEESLDSIPNELLFGLEYSVVVEPNNIKVMLSYENRKDIFLKSSKVAFFFLPILKLQGGESIDSIRSQQDKYILKRCCYTKSELEALNWTITYP